MKTLISHSLLVFIGLSFIKISSTGTFLNAYTIHNSNLWFYVVKLWKKKIWGSLRAHIKLLTILDLGKTNLLSSEIGEFIHLKFLCINGHGRVMLLSSICRLVNLQSLDLGSNFGSIPYSIWKLQQLRHLICGNFKISSQSKISKCVNGYLGVEQLTNLRTLALKEGVGWKKCWISRVWKQKTSPKDINKEHNE